VDIPGTAAAVAAPEDRNHAEGTAEVETVVLERIRSSSMDCSSSALADS